VLIYAGFALRRAAPTLFSRTPPGLTRIQRTASYYGYSPRDSDPREGLPVIICIGNTLEAAEVLTQFVGQFDEPVLLIWSELLAKLSEDSALEDATVWEEKRQEFARAFSQYREAFRFDERRAYLTGFGFAGAYAWMLAYDRSELFAGVVAMSAPSYPPPIQQRLDSGGSVVTVVVWGEKDSWFQKHQDQEKQTGQDIEARNPHAKFILKPGEDHREAVKDWVENLRYVLQFKKGEANTNSLLRPRR